jgi:hypothetical protein
MISATEFEQLKDAFEVVTNLSVCLGLLFGVLLGLCVRPLGDAALCFLRNYRKLYRLARLVIY